MCACGKTKSAFGFCDGSHVDLGKPGASKEQKLAAIKHLQDMMTFYNNMLSNVAADVKSIAATLETSDAAINHLVSDIFVSYGVDTDMGYMLHDVAFPIEQVISPPVQ
jgi:hypothetical protein